MSERIKCVVLTKDADGKVGLVGEFEREDALILADKMAKAGEPEGGQVEVFSPDNGGIFFDDGSTKAYNDALEAARKAKEIAAKSAAKEAEAARIAALKAELAKLEGKPKPATKKAGKK